ncbi:hypothetical protein Ciccas_006392 [Cichlidogyrus casuarinus]|uniref:Uncharacterized protein n=1 Tax=Cichlidogyrus casuarinus TaxID=1844966 RepID=A0ABD2Q5X0_9PLAT
MNKVAFGRDYEQFQELLRDINKNLFSRIKSQAKSKDNKAALDLALRDRMLVLLTQKKYDAIKSLIEISVESATSGKFIE